MTASRAGHVFVTRGMLENFVSDAVLLTTDSDFWVMQWFFPALKVDSLASARELRPDNWPDPGSGRAADGRAVWFLDVGGRSVGEICSALATALADVVGADLSPGNGRTRPLVVMPMPGIGYGGSKPGQVIQAVLQTVEEAVMAAGAPDVAIVIPGRETYAAVQTVRRSRGRWPLSTEQVKVAVGIGVRARQGELALFAGAGVSVPAGLPSWDNLIELAMSRLGDRAPAVPSKMNPLDRAEMIRRIDDTILPEVVSEACKAPQHALGHALLNALGCRQNVTTNFDGCFELAAKTFDDLVVLPEERPSGNQRWLLKMHGSYDDPDSIVLTRSDFVRYDMRYRPAASVVQSLVLTRHVLFVGVSLQDDNVLRLVYEVSLMRERGELQQHWGTVLHLGAAPEKQALYGHELDWVIAEGDDAAREIEIILDVAAAHASEDVPWLMHPDYREMLDADEQQAVTDLEHVARKADELATREPARWGPVVAALRASGWRAGHPPAVAPDGPRVSDASESAG